jgi:GAF domain-containing protein/HAMP domain-containing protein
MLIVLVGGLVLGHRPYVWLAAAIGYIVYVVLVNRFEPLPRYDALGESQLVFFFDLGLTAALILLAFWFVARAFRTGTIRTRLMISFIALVLVTAAIVTTGSFVFGYQTQRSQAVNNLELAATFKQSQLEAWVQDLQFDLAAALTEAYDLYQARTVLWGGDMPEEDRAVAYEHVRGRFRHLVERTERFQEIFLVDLDGRVILSTDRLQEGKVRRGEGYFEGGLLEPTLDPPVYDPASGRISAIAAQPLVDEDGELLGVLAGRANVAVLRNVMLERSKLGMTGETYLVAADGTLLTPSRFGDSGIHVLSEGASRALAGQTEGWDVYEDYYGSQVVGVYRWLPTLEVALLAEQDEGEVFGAVRETLVLNLGLSLFAAVAAAIGALVASRDIGRPLTEIADLATQVADGDLDRMARIHPQREFATLARAFNSMTAQLRHLVTSLEARVTERTRDLERRSAYLEASAEVGRAAASILDTDVLIRQVVDLIRERFELYYVGLFLVDEAQEFAVLRAGTGEAGRAMLARGHSIRIGEGMIGWSVANAQPRVALEAGEDAVRLATPELPETRSEAALPLRSRGRVLGALSVQSAVPGAFDEETITALQTMSDQVAVALDNARLFAESEAALDATRRAYGELSRQAWASLLQTRADLGYRSDERGVTGTGDLWRAEEARALQEGHVVLGASAGSTSALAEDGGGGHSLAVPIKLRDQVLGVVATSKPTGAGEWTPDEVALLESLVGQIGLALESARLYDESQRRAARERLTREVTDRMRRATDVEGIVQTVVDELFDLFGPSRAFVSLGATDGESVDGWAAGQPTGEAADAHSGPVTGGEDGRD